MIEFSKFYALLKFSLGLACKWVELHILLRVLNRQQRNVRSNYDFDTELLSKSMQILKPLCIAFPQMQKKNGQGHWTNVKKRENNVSLPNDDAMKSDV